jgi:hypothetical protein
MTTDNYLVLANACTHIVVSIVGMVYSKDKDSFRDWVMVFLCGVTVAPALIISILIIPIIFIYIVMEGIPFVFSKIFRKKFND